MKNLFIIFFIILLAGCSHGGGSSTPKTTDDISGEWSWEGQGDQFSLTLRQAGDSITGHHCAVFGHGDKIDCAVYDENTITGIIRGKKVLLNFRSLYGGKKGMAEIRMHGSDSLSWKITKVPACEFYFPGDVILHRERNKK